MVAFPELSEYDRIQQDTSLNDDIKTISVLLYAVRCIKYEAEKILTYFCRKIRSGMEDYNVQKNEAF